MGARGTRRNSLSDGVGRGRAQAIQLGGNDVEIAGEFLPTVAVAEANGSHRLAAAESIESGAKSINGSDPTVTEPHQVKENNRQDNHGRDSHQSQVKSEPGPGDVRLTGRRGGQG